MWLNKFYYGQVFVAFLLFSYDLTPTSATNVAQLKNQQHALGQTSTTSIQQQHRPLHVSPQPQHQLHHQTTSTSVGLAAHPTIGINSNAESVLRASNTGQLNTEAQDLSSSLSSSASSQTSATLAHLPSSTQYNVHDKDMQTMQEIFKHFNTETNLNDQYQLLSDLKRETHDNAHQSQPPPPPFYPFHVNNMANPWNFYGRPYAPVSFTPSPAQMTGLFTNNFNPFETFSTPYPVTPRFLPIMSFPQPIYIPYPFIMTPDMFNPSFSGLSQMPTEYEDSMSRGTESTRRPVSSQHSSDIPSNSPIFYVRVPPTPYMFLPSLGTSSMSSYSNIIPYNGLTSFPSFSSVFNVPINFLANGKPTNIYQMSAPPNDLPNSLQFSNIPSNFNTRPPPPPLTNAYRPAASSHNYFSPQLPPVSSSSSLHYVPYPGTSASSETSSSTPTVGASSSLSPHDSKLTALKHPYYFNGRPEEIYILPNNFNSLYSSEGSYY